MGFEPRPLGFERPEPATGKGVMEGRQHLPVELRLGLRVVGVLGACVAPALPGLVPSALQDLRVDRALRKLRFLDDLEEPL